MLSQLIVLIGIVISLVLLSKMCFKHIFLVAKSNDEPCASENLQYPNFPMLALGIIMV